MPQLVGKSTKDLVVLCFNIQPSPYAEENTLHAYSYRGAFHSKRHLFSPSSNG